MSIFLIQFRAWFYRSFLSSPQGHDARVSKIQADVRNYMSLPVNERKPLCTARPNWLSLSTTFFNKEACNKV